MKTHIGILVQDMGWHVGQTGHELRRGDWVRVTGPLLHPIYDHKTRGVLPVYLPRNGKHYGVSEGYMVVLDVDEADLYQLRIFEETRSVLETEFGKSLSFLSIHPGPQATGLGIDLCTLAEHLRQHPSTLAGRLGRMVLRHTDKGWQECPEVKKVWQ